LIFGAVEVGLGYDEFVQFSDALSLPVICETYFKNCRTKFLKTISQEYAKQAPLFQLLVANLNDTFDFFLFRFLLFFLISNNRCPIRNFSLDATFSHKRQADFALATLISINSLIVAFAAVMLVSIFCILAFNFCLIPFFFFFFVFSYYFRLLTERRKIPPHRIWSSLPVRKF